jgi:hypothetical protein
MGKKLSEGKKIWRIRKLGLGMSHIGTPINKTVRTNRTFSKYGKKDEIIKKN